MWAIFRRDFTAGLRSAVGFTFLAVFLAGSLIWLFEINRYFEIGPTALRRWFFGGLPLFLVFLVPTLAMRSWAEEWQAGRGRLLLSAPVSTIGLVAGKFLAVWAQLVLALVLTAPVPVMVAYTVNPETPPDWGMITTGYLGALLLGGALAAIGQAASACTNHQASAYIFTLGIIVLLVAPFFLLRARFEVPQIVVQSLSFIALPLYMEDFSRGVIALRELAYFFALIAFFLYATLEAIAWRRRSGKLV